MAEHVLTVLRAKRDQISAQVHDTEKKLAKMRAGLANLDAAMALLMPDHPDFIAPPKPKTRYFGHNELARLVRETLRDATRALSAGEVTAAIMAKKGFTEAHHLAVTKMVVARLGLFGREGAVVKSGKTRDARWATDRVA
ncbi:MAG TPA: hypothetical protein VHX61_10410 [Rhizomicrobium sp.]|jgi:hypothetical protein|nr:hypothetical protein [Rhizomicrobium sp.]